MATQFDTCRINLIWNLIYDATWRLRYRRMSRLSYEFTVHNKYMLQTVTYNTNLALAVEDKWYTVESWCCGCMLGSVLCKRYFISYRNAPLGSCCGRSYYFMSYPTYVVKYINLIIISLSLYRSPVVIRILGSKLSLSTLFRICHSLKTNHFKRCSWPRDFLATKCDAFFLFWHTAFRCSRNCSGGR